MQRIGVFVCWCGSNIAATVDVEAVAEALSHEAGVVFSTNYQYMCSQAGQELIQDTIREQKLTGVVICSCSPRMHENTFRKTCERAGINPYMVEIANIREQCSWIHKDKAVGTEKAIILGRAAIAKVLLNAPLTAGTSPVVKRALVIGGGIAGIQTALDIADAGFPVDIVEKEPTIGGKMTQIDKTFPTLDCAACILTPKMVDAAQNENIKIYAYSQVEAVKGFVGNFTVTIRRKARYVDETKCTGCGLCTEKCPQKKVPNAFNLGLDTRRAIYIPFAQAVPKIATIDADYCTMLKTGKCGVCSKVCTAGAIDYKQQDTLVEEQYGAIVVATGYNPIKLDQFDEFAYSQSPDVVTSLELERLMNAAGPTGGTLLRPSDKTHPHTLVFVQCVGSRCDGGEKGKPYCSKICCMYTAKHAMLIREKYPDTEVYVFYIDVQFIGKENSSFNRISVIVNLCQLKSQPGNPFAVTGFRKIKRKANRAFFGIAFALRQFRTGCVKTKSFKRIFDGQFFAGGYRLAFRIGNNQLENMLTGDGQRQNRKFPVALSIAFSQTLRIRYQQLIVVNGLPLFGRLRSRRTDFNFSGISAVFRRYRQSDDRQMFFAGIETENSG